MIKPKKPCTRVMKTNNSNEKSKETNEQPMKSINKQRKTNDNQEKNNWKTISKLMITNWKTTKTQSIKINVPWYHGTTMVKKTMEINTNYTKTRKLMNINESQCKANEIKENNGKPNKNNERTMNNQWTSMNNTRKTNVNHDY